MPSPVVCNLLKHTLPTICSNIGAALATSKFTYSSGKKKSDPNMDNVYNIVVEQASPSE
jgi:hypothetical protein